MAALTINRARSLTALSVCAIAVSATMAHAGLPGDCVAVTRVESVDTVTQVGGAFLSEVEPGMNAQMLTMLMGQGILNPMLAGVDRTKPWWILSMDPMKYGKKPAWVVPITARGQFEGALATMLTKGETTDGVTTFSGPNDQSTMVAFTETHVVVAKNKPTCQAALGLWAAGDVKPELIAVAPDSRVLSATVDVAKVWAVYKPMVTGAVQTFKQMATYRMQQNPQPGVDAQRTMAILEAEIEWFLAVAEQSDQISLALALDTSAARVELAWAFKDGSPLAAFLAAQQPGQLGLLKYLPPDVIVAGGSRTDGLDHFMEWYMGFLDKLLADADQELMTAMREQVQAWAGAWDGEAAAALVTPPEGRAIEGVYVIGIKDAATAEAKLVEMMSNTEAMKRLGVGMGQIATIQFEKGVETYKDYAIHRQTTTFDLENMQAQQAAMLRKMFGETIATEISVVGDKVVMAFGGDVRERLKQVIDGVLGDGAGFTDARAMTETFASVPAENLHGLVFVSVGDMLDWVRLITPVPIPPLSYDSSSGVGITTRLGGRSMDVQLIAPVDEIVAIRQAIRTAKQGAAQP